jgi:hypothetical protein
VQGFCINNAELDPATASYIEIPEVEDESDESPNCSLDASYLNTSMTLGALAKRTKEKINKSMSAI